MRGKWLLVLAAVLLPALALITLPALAEAQDEPAEWTVMFYFCGSDLESKYGYASGNLLEISRVIYPDSYRTHIAHYYGLDPASMDITMPGKVNVLVETGGSKSWHTQNEDTGDSLDMDIDVNALQRWRYNIYPQGGTFPDGPWDGYELMQTLPL
ncbi:MAG: hypothetical protein IKQ80_02015, partial [Clostridia bacterium]|nr:hypothetical protein [Clostridia bacterium]